MSEICDVGHGYDDVKLKKRYWYGLDDHEWVVAFESDKAEDFLDLVMALRETEGSRYTLRDTPIFTCIHKSLKETLDTLGGERGHPSPHRNSVPQSRHPVRFSARRRSATKGALCHGSRSAHAGSHG